jgi:hypothetical protein
MEGEHVHRKDQVPDRAGRRDRDDRRRLSRRRFLREVASAGVAMGGAYALLTACAPLASGPTATAEPTAAAGDPGGGEGAQGTPTREPRPAGDGSWVPPASHAGDVPTGTGSVEIAKIGTFSFDASQVKIMRPDIFQPGHFSLFDILVALDGRGDIALDTHFDEGMDTHVIDAINGQSGWWYQAHYSNGWFEPNVFRMDMYPYKNDTRIQLYRERDEARLAAIYGTFEEEGRRLADNDGQVILPELAIRSPKGDWAFRDVAVTPHNVRSDLLQEGVVTALDALISLAEREELYALQLTWYERIGAADPVGSYWVSQINEAQAVGGCGFVYETGPRAFAGFSGAHIHIPADARAIVSPEYALWFWICL